MTHPLRTFRNSEIRGSMPFNVAIEDARNVAHADIGNSERVQQLFL
jgi:hypothetical protein